LLTALAEVQLGQGDARRALGVANEAIEVASRTQIRAAEIRALLARSRVLMTLDGADARGEIEAALERALAIVGSTGARAFEPQIYLERARLADLLSDATSRERWLREAHRLFGQIGATGHADRVAPLMSEPPR
jgi:hypothetical protein